MPQQIHLNFLDLSVFILYLFLAVGLGFLVSAGKKKTTRGYFLGGKTLPWYVVATSMLASDVSSEHFIANAGIGFTYGIVAATGSWNSWIIYSIFIWIFLPYYVRTNLYTIPEFLERRYSPICRYIFSASLLVGYVAAILAGTLYAGGLAFERMIGPFLHTGFLADSHNQIVIGIFFFAILTGAYTIYGGLRSAAWTDFMQVIVLGIGGVIVPILGLKAVGGFSSLFHYAPDHFQVFLPIDHPKFPFTGIFTGFLTVGIWYTCTSQHMVQRVLASKNEWHARMGVIGAGYLHIITPFFFVFPGIIAYKLLGPKFKPADSSYLTLVELLLKPGFRGLILAAMAAALMSNLSAVLNSASTLVTIDFYKKLINPNSTDAQQVRIGRLAGTLILSTSAVLAWHISLTPGVPLFVKVQNIFFFIAPPFSVIFCAGLLWRRANTIAALVTIPTGFAFSWAFDYFIKGQQGVYLHRAFFTWCFCVIVMTIVSLMTKPLPAEQVEPILWTRKYAKLPPEEKAHYHGLKDFRLWWLLFVAITLAIYSFFLWFRFQHPIPMFG
ncbi:MAG TPA: sodium/solute symporter [Tepidisphaeraceae bacterium]|jgi:SSS family solute:Na+ symporter|nr:sodium/solute symporter [Tepidisphaeraceae bacterium]